jgi:hypothetical protein
VLKPVNRTTMSVSFHKHQGSQSSILSLANAMCEHSLVARVGNVTVDLTESWWVIE